VLLYLSGQPLVPPHACQSAQYTLPALSLFGEMLHFSLVNSFMYSFSLGSHLASSCPVFPVEKEAIMNDFIQLEPQSNLFEAVTMMEGDASAY
jgi:hypothetical protein